MPETHFKTPQLVILLYGVQYQVDFAPFTKIASNCISS